MSTPPKYGDRFFCSLSGTSANGLDEDTAAFVGPDDDLDDLPVGWARVTIEIRQENPDWGLLQAARQGLVQESVAQMGDTPTNRRLAEILVDGQLGGALDSTPRFVATRDEMHIAPAYLEHAVAALGGEEDDEDAPASTDPVAEPERVPADPVALGEPPTETAPPA